MHWRTKEGTTISWVWQCLREHLKNRILSHKRHQKQHEQAIKICNYSFTCFTNICKWSSGANRLLYMTSLKRNFAERRKKLNQQRAKKLPLHQEPEPAGTIWTWTDRKQTSKYAHSMWYTNNLNMLVLHISSFLLSPLFKFSPHRLIAELL